MRILVAATASAAPLGAGFDSASGVAAGAVAPKQVAIVRLVDRFVRAYNRRDPPVTLAAFAARPGNPRYAGVSDCDDAAGRPVHYRGRAGVVEWLRARFRDRDQLAVRNVRLIAQAGAVVEDRCRQSATLARCGYRRGIVSARATKAGVSPVPARTVVFDAGNDGACRAGGLGGFTPR